MTHLGLAKCLSKMALNELEHRIPYVDYLSLLLGQTTPFDIYATNNIFIRDLDYMHVNYN